MPERILTDAEVEEYERQVDRGGYLWYGHEISRALATIAHYQAEAQAQRERADTLQSQVDDLLADVRIAQGGEDHDSRYA